MGLCARPNMATDKTRRGVDAAEPLSLSDAASYLLDECRMVLPGVQALFGFQLIAVFNPGFVQRVSPGEQRLHLVAIVLVVVAIALVMGPAAYQRQAEPRSVTQRFVSVSSHLLLWSMVPLALGICADVYLVARLVLDSRVGAAAVAATLLAVLGLLWLVLPRSRRLQRLAGSDSVTPPLRRDRGP
jgi:drug/metabolite transporter (DMT)-like permease